MATQDSRPASADRARRVTHPRQLQLLEVHEAPDRALVEPSPPRPVPGPARRGAPARSAPAGRGRRRAVRASGWQLDPATRALGRRRVAEAKELVARLRALSEEDDTRRCA